jgi:RNA polymerase sigma factor (sigma-70 family)
MNLDKLTDLELIHKFQGLGDQLYVAELYKRYAKHIMTIGMGFLKDKGLHQDVAIDVYLTMVNDLPGRKFENSQRFKNWLAVVCKNRCISKLRTIKREGKIIYRYKDTENLDNHVELDDTERYSSVTPDELKKSLDTLTKGQKHCLELLFFDGYMITEGVLKRLELEGMPPNVVNKLKVIKDIDIRGAGFFYDQIRVLIDGDEDGFYKSMIMKYAVISDKKSYKDISESTGYSLKEVKSYIQTGRIKLRNMIKKILEEKENNNDK